MFIEKEYCLNVGSITVYRLVAQKKYKLSAILYLYFRETGAKNVDVRYKFIIMF
jgi:hypothetical protein